MNFLQRTCQLLFFLKLPFGTLKLFSKQGGLLRARVLLSFLSPLGRCKSWTWKDGGPSCVMYGSVPWASKGEEMERGGEEKEGGCYTFAVFECFSVGLLVVYSCFLVLFGWLFFSFPLGSCYFEFSLWALSLRHAKVKHIRQWEK